ncbi:hypothetical protein AMECASPLE_000218 [Ameca splendens]|uniref:C2 domain-containing protein n=1 Tax=Ameca splendens TaxID=208324 RepID=A0ABV0XXH7_9TELE
MPYHDEEYPGQPLWQSVLLFCCKGVIEGIMVVLFFWLLVQVLFTKQLEVHLQVLLLVGLIVFCLSLILGCVLCWKKSDICTAITNPFTPTQASVETVTPVQDPRSSDETTGSRQLCEELDGEVLEYPSTFTSPTPSESGHFSQAFSNQTQPASDENEQATSHFSLRRFSSPLQTAPLYKPIHPSRASLPLLPKLGMLTRKCKAMQRRCTVAGDYRSSDERSRLTWSSMNSKLIPEKPIPLVPLSYGSSASCKPPLSKFCLHFTVAFSLEQQTLTVTVLNLTGRPQRLEDVTVLGCLPPLHTCPSPATTQSSCNPESNSLVLILKVSSLNELKNCELRLALYVPKEQSQRATALGEVVVKCGERDWRSEHSFHFIKELDQNNVHIEKDALICKEQSCPPQILIALEYQVRTHSIRTTVLSADNLDSLAQTSAAADYQVQINLHHDGVLISSRETHRHSCPTWSSSFVFELPPGDINQLPISLQFIIMQNQTLSEAKVVGRVLIGAGAAEAGRAHWRDVCSLHVELVRLHIVHAEPPKATALC